MTVRKNSRERSRISSMTFHGKRRGMPSPAVPNIIGSSYVLTAKVVVGEKASGVICAQGGRFSGYSLYCAQGVLTFCQNIGGSEFTYLRSAEPLAPGDHEVRYVFDYDGGALGNGGNGSLWVDGRQVCEERVERTMRFQFPIGEEFHVGADPFTPVTTEYAALDNEFDGEITWCRLELTGGDGISEAERDRMETAVQ
jgi:hypothetical protein